ncbi:hypothetical protein L226DRAFT_371563 [Lentinus tigrinus ALCF2SS1-7]|uniref:Uncharacterized protein n=1 Tax=Lentinus tigrinus ALCF2SS1-6 TaxID=1328759 RepID=A0A5C2SL99_9APHY|nr:hypothetical protein L227DRAFT_316679 [Lentinus tigrinus ALCF2SS1-6]RPD76256.1 hypothetical protein L226DRAFT_371563 [Lentinus tigrinus ALCF2SS1-7]
MVVTGFLYVLGWIVICTHDFLDLFSRNQTRNRSGIVLKTVLSTLVSSLLRKSLLWLLPNVATHTVFCIFVIHAMARLGLQAVGCRHDAVAWRRNSIIRSRLTMVSSWCQLHKPSHPSSKPDNSEIKGNAALDQVDATRLALLICSCYERAMTRQGSSSTYGRYANATDGAHDTTGDTMSRKRRELLGLFFALASSQLSRSGLESSSSSSRAKIDRLLERTTLPECDGQAPLASGTSIHDLVVSASTPEGLELALSARKSYPSGLNLPVDVEIPVPAPPPSFTSYSEEVPLQAVELLEEVTRDRDLFRTRAYQLAFKVDDLHNRHSQTLCALERAEATIEQLQGEERNLSVALASVLSATFLGKTPVPTSSLSAGVFVSTVTGQQTTSLYSAGSAKDGHLRPHFTTTANTDEVVLYPRTPSRNANAPTVLEPTEPLLLPVSDAAGSLTSAGDLDGSCRKTPLTRAFSPTKSQRRQCSASAEEQEQESSMTRLLLGKIYTICKGEGAVDGQFQAEVEVAPAKALRPLPSGWLPATSDSSLSRALEPDWAVNDDDDDEQMTLGRSQTDFLGDDDVSGLQATQTQHDTRRVAHTAAVPPSAEDQPTSRRHSWMHPEVTLQYTTESLAWRYGQGTLERSNSSDDTTGPGGLRTQRSTTSLNSFDRPTRTRVSSGPAQMLSDASSNWRERTPTTTSTSTSGVINDDAIGEGGRTRGGRRSFGFGAGGTRADEMCRQNAPYFQGFQGQAPPLRRSQSTIGSEVRTSSAASDNDLRRRSSLADKLVMDNVWNRRAQERAAAAAEMAQRAQSAVTV